MSSITVKSNISLIKNVALKLIKCSNTKLNIYEMKRTTDNKRNAEYIMVGFSSTINHDEKHMEKHMDAVVEVLNRCNVLDKLIQQYIEFREKTKKHISESNSKVVNKKSTDLEITDNELELIDNETSETSELCIKFKEHYLSANVHDKSFMKKWVEFMNE
jgi:hypothetical protein